MKRHVYIGWDSREIAAYDVACKTLRRHASVPVQITALKAAELYDQQLLWRPVEQRDGKLWDHLSQANCSTEFANSRFVVPFLHRSGWCLFADCDVVFMRDVEELFKLADPRHAVMVVKHRDGHKAGEKMDGQVQALYPMKNASSVTLWNCSHVAHHRFTLPMLNHWPGVLLHRFAWLRDEEIGELPGEWNWLVGVEPKPEAPAVCHFTLGHPGLSNWPGAEHDEIWLKARDCDR